MNSKSMKNTLSILICFIIIMTSCESQPTYETLTDYPIYEGTDLGFTYTPKETAFRLWSPAAQEVKLNIYSAGNGDNLESTYKMKRDDAGTWTFKASGDLQDKYYTYQVMQNGEWLQEKPDLYAVAVGVNGQRSMIVDLDETDPEGWANDQRPALEN